VVWTLPCAETKIEELTNLVATVEVLVFHFTIQLVYREQIVCLIAW
jgi:hypothetical protein